MLLLRLHACQAEWLVHRLRRLWHNHRLFVAEHASSVLVITPKAAIFAAYFLWKFHSSGCTSDENTRCICRGSSHQRLERCTCLWFRWEVRWKRESFVLHVEVVGEKVLFGKTWRIGSKTGCKNRTSPGCCRGGKVGCTNDKPTGCDTEALSDTARRWNDYPSTSER